MALSLLRRRPSTEAHQVTTDPRPSTPTKKGLIPSLPPSFLLLIIITIWFSSLLLSSSFHLCVYSRKLQPYCITGGTGRSRFGAVKALLNQPLDDNATASAAAVVDERHVVVVDQHRKQEIAKAVKVVEEQMQQLRSWAGSNSGAATTCDGRGIFVYDLPPKFNKELMERCGGLLPWTDLCDYFTNEAMGQPIPEMGRGWYRTHQYALEPIFHLRVMKHRCRVYNPDDAKLFYVPFYGGLDILRWHFKNVSSDVKDALGVELVRWLQTQNPWARNAGRDHMFVLGKISWDFRRNDRDSWGSNFLSLEAMQNPYKFLIERQPWEMNDIGIPHPTHFHPHTDGDIAAWQSRIIGSHRRSLVSFAGAPRAEAAENIRSALIKQCVSRGEGECRFLDCSSGSCANPPDLIALFTESEFCLQPPGDSPTRKSVFDSLVLGCIPVLFDPFTAYYQYPWHLPEDHRRYSVFVDQEEVREGEVDVIERLKGVPLAEREEMRRYIVYELVPGLVYGDSSSEFVKFRDAFSIVMDNMIDRASRSQS